MEHSRPSPVFSSTSSTPSTSGTPSIYHCVPRCVRGAYLCGVDKLTGRSFEHRKGWIENRVLELVPQFAVAVYGYAVKSNHYHLVVETHPKAPWVWSDEEVASRWLFVSGVADYQIPKRMEDLVAQPQRLEVLRGRLGSLSWFMRRINEPIARRANQEDECRGHFWEARSRRRALLDEAAVRATMVGEDLKPLSDTCAADGRHHSSASTRARDSVLLSR